jgi:hypothetical protein
MAGTRCRRSAVPSSSSTACPYRSSRSRCLSRPCRPHLPRPSLCLAARLWTAWTCVEGVSLVSRAGKGEEGSGRWPARPAAKLLRVGVFTDGSSAWISSPPLDSGKNRLFGRGVVGVVSSPARPAGSGTFRVVLTAWKVDMVGRSCSWSTGCTSRQAPAPAG